MTTFLYVLEQTALYMIVMLDIVFFLAKVQHKYCYLWLDSGKKIFISGPCTRMAMQFPLFQLFMSSVMKKN